MTKKRLAASTTDPMIVAIIRVSRALKKLPTMRSRLWALGHAAHIFGCEQEAQMIAGLLIGENPPSPRTEGGR